MPEFNNISFLLVMAGLILIIVGALFHFFGGLLSWFGHLPGDIHIEKENFNFYFPITTMILISIILNIIIRIIFYFRK